MPDRIQMRRAKGWRKPIGSIYVGRPGPFGNPFVIDVDGDRETVVAKFRVWIAGSAWYGGRDPALARRGLRELAGKNLACWCPLPAPGEPDICHAAVLLELANK